MAVSATARARGRTTRSLRNRNFRLYVVGQGLSQVGAWFQITAEIWTIVQISGEGKAVALHSILRFGPVVLFAVPGSLFSGRYNRRRLLMATQTIFGLGALVVAVVAFRSSLTLPLIYTTVFIQGLVFSIDNPVRRAFLRDMVSDDEMQNAMSLNSSMEVLARAVGPAIAGVVIATVGVDWCFALNAVSFAAVVTSLALMDSTKLRPDNLLSREPGQLRAGFSYLWSTPRIRRTFGMSVVVFMFAWNWQVVLPVYTATSLDGDSKVYGLLVGLLGVGAFIGTVIVARISHITGRYFRVVCALLAVALLLAAIAPSVALAVVGLALLGAAGTAFQIGAQTRLQLESSDIMIGRIVAMYSVVSVGAKPFAALIAGLMIDAFNPRVAFGVGAIAMMLLTVVLAGRRASRLAAAAP